MTLACRTFWKGGEAGVSVCEASCLDLETLGQPVLASTGVGVVVVGEGEGDTVLTVPLLVYRSPFTVYQPLSVNSFLFTVALLSGWSIITAQIIKITIIQVLIYWIFSQYVTLHTAVLSSESYYGRQ